MIMGPNLSMNQESTKALGQMDRTTSTGGEGGQVGMHLFYHHLSSPYGSISLGGVGEWNIVEHICICMYNVYSIYIYTHISIDSLNRLHVRVPCRGSFGGDVSSRSTSKGPNSGFAASADPCKRATRTPSSDFLRLLLVVDSDFGGWKSFWESA